MAEKKHELQQTKGMFQFRGKVTGVDKDNFYKETKTKNGNPWRTVNFGLEIDKEKNVYCSLNGGEKKSVYFTKKNENGKFESKEVPWSERRTFNADGFKLIGVNLGLTKTVDKSGQEVNDKRTMVDFDACSYIADNLADGASVFVKGKIDHSSYNNRHYTKFVPNQISLCKPVDFDDEGYKVLADFEQTICFTGIDKTADGFTIHGYTIGYSDITEVEMYMTSKYANFAKTLKKLKPYTSVTLVGYIAVEAATEEVANDDGDAWGDTEANSFTKVSAATERKMYVVAGKSDSIDTTLYTEESVTKAIAQLKQAEQAKSDFGSSDDSDDWGSVGSSIDDDSDDEWD